MLTYDMNQRKSLSLYEYLYRCIKRDIENGEILADEKLPSKRTLAKHLGVSLITVEGAYAQLEAEGYLYSRERRGYYAMPLPVSAAQGTPHPAGGPRRFDPIPNQVPQQESDTIDFAHPRATIGPHVQRLWAKALRSTLSDESDTQHLQPLPIEGSPRLRNAIADHLRQFRGMEVDPRCIVIGSGAQTLYNFIVQLLGRNCGYAMEDPGYAKLFDIYTACGAQAHPIQMDDQGISLPLLRESGAQVVHIMPSHQFPTGKVTSIARRYELLAWAAQADDRYIIEDDFDCEFRLAGRPIPALQSIDTLGKVIYTNTFTKSLSPDMRVAYMILPQALMERFERELGFYSSTVSALIQNALAGIIESGDYERHINRVRNRHRILKDALIAQLEASEYGALFHTQQADAGLHFVLRMNVPATDAQVVAAAKAHGLCLAPLSAYYHDPETAQNASGEYPQFVIHYSMLDKAQIPHAVERLNRTVADCL
ncbi:MAG: PLP-dependent aminotransferase family protein [Eggerthellaceae bacterium]|jgi:GntR family transcriptional regulator/MocR family aminotransferase